MADDYKISFAKEKIAKLTCNQNSDLQFILTTKTSTGILE